MRRPLLTLLLALVLGTLAIWATTRSTPQTMRARLRNTAADEPELRALLEESRRANLELAARVEELRASVEALRNEQGVARKSAPGENETITVPDGAVSATQIAALTELVGELKATLDRHVEDSQTAEQRAAALQRAMEEQPEANWVTLGELLEQHRMDEERARMDVTMLSFSSIVERYGKPHLTWGGDKGVTWVYGRDYLPESESYRLQLVFHFVDGLVTRFWVEEN